MTENLVNLTCSDFGSLYINGVLEIVKKYTWTNQNKVLVQVITYGARIHNIRMPDRKGIVLDIVLGFEDIQGYFYYNNHYFNTVIGRVTNLIENGTLVIDGKQFDISKNADVHNYNGGFYGLDKANFQSYQTGNKVIMSHILQDGEDGFPGDLMVVISYELNVRNEFKTNIEAYCTKPTLCNISNLVYFNLGGSSTGTKTLYEHIVQINANCYTLSENDLPTGQIMNVVHTKFDLQVPTRLGNLIGIAENDGYNQNFCINRGVDQESCFAARVSHPQSGRVLEIYTNQPGLQFYTANDLGSGIPASKYNNIGMATLALIHSAETRNLFELVERLNTHVIQNGTLEDSDDYVRLRVLIAKLIKCEKYGSQATTIDENLFGADDDLIMTNPDFELGCILRPLEIQYLLELRTAAADVESTTNYTEVKEVIDKILTNNYSEEQLQIEDLIIESPDVIRRPTFDVDVDKKSASPQLSVLIKENKPEPTCAPKESTTVCSKAIPERYKDGRVHGRYGAIYVRHGAFCMQTQNYPNAIYHQNFPNCILRPGERYNHTIVYKFWVQPGNPAKYNRRINKQNITKQTATAGSK